MAPKSNTEKRKANNLIWYRIKKHKSETALSILFAVLFTYILYYIAGKAYPDCKPFDKIINKISPPGKEHNQHYTFYSGEPGSVYYQVGQGVDISEFSDGDSIENKPTDGGYDNALRVSKYDKSFALVPKLVLDGEDNQVRSSTQIVAPLFIERLHIFYRKNLFPKQLAENGNEIQLSATTDHNVLRVFRNSVKNIYVSNAGNSTFILSSYVLALIGKQIKENFDPGKSVSGRNEYKKIFIPFSEACKSMMKPQGPICNHRKDSIIDIMFWVGADPTSVFEKILSSNKYALMSVDPSFVAVLNNDYHLNLEVTNIPKEYYSNGRANDISTISTMAYLIASREIPRNDVLNMAKTMDDDIGEINGSIIRDNMYADSKKDSTKLLGEFGFYKFLDNNYKDSISLQWKDWLGMITFIIAMITFFFPLLKSINGIKSVFNSWYFNKRIDEYLLPENVADIRENFGDLNMKITDLYGDGDLSEAHYNALEKRISIHLPDNMPSVVKPIGSRDDHRDDDKKTA